MGHVRFFPLDMRAATSGKLGTQEVPFFPLVDRAMAKGKFCTLPARLPQCPLFARATTTR
jgi:hypothetical protein